MPKLGFLKSKLRKLVSFNLKSGYWFKSGTKYQNQTIESHELATQKFEYQTIKSIEKKTKKR